MESESEIIARTFLELASEQRISILLSLHKKRNTISKMAKELDATVPEVYRNFERLSNAGLIEKYNDGDYGLTLYGITVCKLVPSLTILSKMSGYFKNHQFGNLPAKYIERIGELHEGKVVTGFVRIMEKWGEMYENSQEYIYNILSEVPYSLEIAQTLADKLEKGVEVRSIFSESAVIPKERKQILKKINFEKYVKNGRLQRKMSKEIQMAVLLTDKEAGAIFPNNSGEPDMSKMLYSDDKRFHEWCRDYFTELWNSSRSFDESRLV